MAEKCENKACTTGRAADFILYIPTTIVGDVEERKPTKLCAPCALVMWREDRSLMWPSGRREDSRIPRMDELIASSKERAV